MALCDFLERQGILRHRAHRWTPKCASVARYERHPHTLRGRGLGVPRGRGQEGAIQPEDGSRREDYRPLDEVLQFANIPRPGIRGQKIDDVLWHCFNLLAELLGEA